MTIYIDFMGSPGFAFGCDKNFKMEYKILYLALIVLEASALRIKHGKGSPVFTST